MCVDNLEVAILTFGAGRIHLYHLRFAHFGERIAVALSFALDVDLRIVLVRVERAATGGQGAGTDDREICLV